MRRFRGFGRKEHSEHQGALHRPRPLPPCQLLHSIALRLLDALKAFCIRPCPLGTPSMI